MKKILLVCSAGMSTSLLVSKMKAAAKLKSIDCSINAVAETEIDDYEEEFDIILLGPQVRFLFNKFKERYADKNISVDVISTVDYGTMNGSKVLDYALNLIKK